MIIGKIPIRVALPLLFHYGSGLVTRFVPIEVHPSNFLRGNAFLFFFFFFFTLYQSEKFEILSRERAAKRQNERILMALSPDF